MWRTAWRRALTSSRSSRQPVLASLGGVAVPARPLSVAVTERKNTVFVSGSYRPTVLYRRLNTSWSRRWLNTTVTSKGKVVSFNLPDVGEGINTVVVLEWLVKPGDKVSVGDEVCVVQSDKSSVDICSPYEGTVRELMYKVDDEATKDKPFMMVELEEEEEESSTSEEDSSTSEEEEEEEEESSTRAESSQQPTAQEQPTVQVVQEDRSSASAGKVLATPAVRKMAAEKNIILSDIVGSGKDGRVLKEDILRHLQSSSPQPVSVSTPPPPMPSSPSAVTQDQTVPISGFRNVMVKTMTASGQIPQFGYCDEVDMSKAVELRASASPIMEERGVKFTYLPLIVKAVSLALTSYPVLNSAVNADCTAMTHKAEHNIGIAMDTPQGLVVPNIKQVQHKSIFEIAVELNRIHSLGLQGQLKPADITGGTFSLSNIGFIGGTYTRPLVLPPEVCIGALGRIQELPRFDAAGSVRRAHIMSVSWSADHRVIDGATVARFSNLWKSYLENPSLMTLVLK